MIPLNLFLGLVNTCILRVGLKFFEFFYHYQINVFICCVGLTYICFKLNLRMILTSNIFAQINLRLKKNQFLFINNKKASIKLP